MRIYCLCGTKNITEGVVLPEYPMQVEEIGIKQYMVEKTRKVGNPAVVYRHYPNVDKRSCKHCGTVIYLEG